MQEVRTSSINWYNCNFSSSMRIPYELVIIELKRCSALDLAPLRKNRNCGSSIIPCILTKPILFNYSHGWIIRLKFNLDETSNRAAVRKTIISQLNVFWVLWDYNNSLFHHSILIIYKTALTLNRRRIKLSRKVKIYFTVLENRIYQYKRPCKWM